MDDLDPEVRPDLRDPRWTRRADRQARKYLRKQRRRAFFRRNSNRILSVVALVAIVGLLGLLYRDDQLDRFLPQTNTFADPPATWHVDLNQPFLTTPAAGWSDGTAGIVVPDVAAVGSYPAEAVKAAMEQVRQVIVAARLDRRMLEGHDPEPYLGLLAPRSAAQIRPYFTPGREVEAEGYASKVADGYHLLPVEPKVTGTMSAEVGKDGQLVVHTNYIFAYAFRPNHPETVTDAMDMVVVSRWEDTFEVLNGRNWSKDEWGVWPSDGRGSYYAISCTLSDKGFLAPSFNDRILGGGSAGSDPNSHFDPAKPIPTGSTCPK
jgi:hypothetical protein